LTSIFLSVVNNKTQETSLDFARWGGDSFMINYHRNCRRIWKGGLIW